MPSMPPRSTAGGCWPSPTRCWSGSRSCGWPTRRPARTTWRTTSGRCCCGWGGCRPTGPGRSAPPTTWCSPRRRGSWRPTPTTRGRGLCPTGRSECPGSRSCGRAGRGSSWPCRRPRRPSSRRRSRTGGSASSSRSCGRWTAGSARRTRRCARPAHTTAPCGPCTGRGPRGATTGSCAARRTGCGPRPRPGGGGRRRGAAGAGRRRPLPPSGAAYNRADAAGRHR
jgi:hypothetical protein